MHFYFVPSAEHIPILGPSWYCNVCIDSNVPPAVNCGPFPNLSDGVLAFQQPHTTTTFLSVAIAHCNPGHNYNKNPAIITCLSTGAWSSLGTCDRKYFEARCNLLYQSTGMYVLLVHLGFPILLLLEKNIVAASIGVRKSCTIKDMFSTSPPANFSISGLNCRVNL